MHSENSLINSENALTFKEFDARKTYWKQLSLKDDLLIARSSIILEKCSMACIFDVKNGIIISNVKKNQHIFKTKPSCHMTCLA